MDDAGRQPVDVSSHRWAMDVLLVCATDPPAAELRRAVNAVEAAAVADEAGQPLITVETDAPDAASAVEDLQARAQRLVDRLAEYGCSVERTSRLRDRSILAEPPQAGSLAE
jgi:hypothetical protein